MSSCLSRVGQRASLVLWCGHLFKAATSINPNPVPAGDGKKAPMEIFQDCITCLKKFHKLQKLTLTADLFLTHRENRSSLMLDPVRVHQNILMIHKAADMKQLVNAVAIEISKENLEWKDKMLDANDQLIARSHCN